MPEDGRGLALVVEEVRPHPAVQPNQSVCSQSQIQTTISTEAVQVRVRMVQVITRAVPFLVRGQVGQHAVHHVVEVPKYASVPQAQQE